MTHPQHPLRGQLIDERGRLQMVAIAGEMVGADRIEGDEEDATATW